MVPLLTYHHSLRPLPRMPERASTTVLYRLPQCWQSIIPAHRPSRLLRQTVAGARHFTPVGVPICIVASSSLGSSTKQELWRKVEELFHAALERTPETRRTFLDGMCGADNALRRQVELLLAKEEQAGSFLEFACNAGHDSRDPDYKARARRAFRPLSDRVSIGCRWHERGISRVTRTEITQARRSKSAEAALRRLIPHSDRLRRCFGPAARGRFPKHLQWARIRGRTDEFGRAFASEEFVLLHPDRDRSFRRVDVVGFQGAS
jgi:hypothetical protein